MDTRSRISATLAALAFVTVSGCFRGSAPSAPPPGPPAGMPDLPPDPRAGSKPIGAPALGDRETLPAKPVPGSALNKFFPKGVTFKQEKAGFSLADVKGGTLSITDLASNPPGRDKFSSSTEKIEGYPAVRVGNQGVAILVGSRYQVQVRSVSADKESWLGKVDLAGLEGLK